MILQARDISKTFLTPQRLQILTNVSLEIKQGQSVAICGRSGEGKTTLLHILGTLEPFDSGELIIANTSLNPTQLRNKEIGFIFQAFNLLEDFTALENVLMPARIGRQKIDSKKGLELLHLVGLEDRAHFPAKLLSGGERQRVAIARSLCNDPAMIFADEPSGNLDKANADLVSDLLFHLVKSKNKTLVLVTHDETLANRCDRRFTLCQGVLTETTAS